MNDYFNKWQNIFEFINLKDFIFKKAEIYDGMGP